LELNAMSETLTQIAIRLPQRALDKADKIAAERRKELGLVGRIWESASFTRSRVIREALEKGLLVLGSELKPPAEKKPRAKKGRKPARKA
jgi:hypothetical protein